MTFVTRSDMQAIVSTLLGLFYWQLGHFPFFFFPSDVDDPTAVQLKPILAKVLCSYLYIQNQ